MMASIVDVKKLITERSASPEMKKVAIKKTKVIAGHAMAVRDNSRGEFKNHKLFSSEIIQKEFGADDNKGHDAAQWKNRERDWYNAERRFIFATKSTKQKDKWLDQILKETKSTSPVGKTVFMNMNQNVADSQDKSHSPASGTRQKQIQMVQQTQLLDLPYQPISVAGTTTVFGTTQETPYGIKESRSRRKRADRKKKEQHFSLSD